MKKYFLLICFLPTVTFANIGDDLNNLIQRFWGSTEEKVEQSEPLDIPEVNIPENPTSEDIKKIREEITFEEESLAEFEAEIATSQEKIWQLKNQMVTTRDQLSLLDQELGLANQKISKFKEQEQKWHKDLNVMTREKSDIEALIRVKKRELDKFLQKDFVRNENFGEGGDISILNWLFSKKTVGQILDENRLNKNFVQQKKLKLEELEKLRKNVDIKEQNTALLFHKFSTILERTKEEQRILHDFAEAKARLIARLEYSQGQTEKELENYRREQAESTVFLQNLRSAMKDVEGQVAEKTVFEEAGPILEFPLKVSMKVTASFRDPEYAKKFGRQHDGTDFFAPQGTEIYAPADGTVQKIGNNGYGYSYLIIKHEDDLYTVYGHVSDILVNKDQKLLKGDLIARTGGTPGTRGAGFMTTGPHLHFEVFHNGKYQDAMKYF